jgi:GNAT superfamily N-acetyltransferase
MASASMSVRLATVADVPQIAPLVRQYWEFEAIEGFDAWRIQKLLAGLIGAPERGLIWVAEADRGLCGYLLAVLVFSLEHGGTMAEIDEVFVAEGIRCAGIGSLLVAEAERALAGRGVCRLQLQLGELNQRGRAFYQRHGFHRRAGYELLDKPLPVP